jgi:hypothetical protein
MNLESSNEWVTIVVISHHGRHQRYVPGTALGFDSGLLETAQQLHQPGPFIQYSYFSRPRGTIIVSRLFSCASVHFALCRAAGYRRYASGRLGPHQPNQVLSSHGCKQGPYLETVSVKDRWLDAATGASLLLLHYRHAMRRRSFFFPFALS